MKQDQLEDFIREHKNAFDDREPSEGIWTKIDRSLSFGKTGWWNSVTLWRAAAVIFMVLSVYLLIPKNTGRLQNEIALKEFTDIEAFYTRQISEKVELIDEFQQPQGRSEGLNGFTHDFQQLEAMYLVLREEMKTRPSQKVKDALVLNLLVRVDLLNQQLHKLEKGDYSSEAGEEKAKANI
jgi:hypothetical protein